MGTDHDQRRIMRLESGERGGGECRGGRRGNSEATRRRSFCNQRLARRPRQRETAGREPIPGPFAVGRGRERVSARRRRVRDRERRGGGVLADIAQPIEPEPEFAGREAADHVQRRRHLIACEQWHGVIDEVLVTVIDGERHGAARQRLTARERRDDPGQGHGLELPADEGELGLEVGRPHGAKATGREAVIEENAGLAAGQFPGERPQQRTCNAT